MGMRSLISCMTGKKGMDSWTFGYGTCMETRDLYGDVWISMILYGY